MAKVIMVNNVMYDNCFESITWSGDYETPHRTLEVTYLKEAIPNLQAGDWINFILDGRHVFRGKVFSTGVSAKSSELSNFTAYDSAVYLSKNKMVENYVKTSPSLAVKQICGKLGLEVGELPADHSKAVSTFPAFGWEASKILKTFYTFQSKYTKKYYSICDYEGRIQVIEMGKLSTYMLNSNTNIRSANYSTSIEDMVNKIIIYKSDSKTNANTVVGVQSYSDEIIKRYGLIQDVVEYNSEQEKPNLADYKDGLRGVDCSASISCDGSIELVAGFSVGVDVNQDVELAPGKKMCGIFYIKSDTHTWTASDYITDLDLSFDELRNLEDVSDIEKKALATEVVVTTGPNGETIINGKMSDADYLRWAMIFEETNRRVPTREDLKEYMNLVKEREKEQ